MIHLHMTLDKFSDGSYLYSGICVVERETITTGTVINSHLPEPSSGFIRKTTKWEEDCTEDPHKKNIHTTYTGRCVFEIFDTPMVTK